MNATITFLTGLAFAFVLSMAHETVERRALACEFQKNASAAMILEAPATFSEPGAFEAYDAWKVRYEAATAACNWATEVYMKFV